MPDLVLYLNMNEEETATREGFGDEIYEKKEFQEKVRKVYAKLFESNWVTVDGNGTPEEVHQRILGTIEEFRKNNSELKEVGKVWV